MVKKSSRPLKEEAKRTSASDLVTLRIPVGLHEDIQAEAKRIGATNIDMTRILWEFYNFEHLDIFIRRLRERYLEGLSSEEIAHLSVLYSLLGYINMRSKLLE